MAGVPRLECHRVSSEADWSGIPVVPLADTVTGKPPQQETRIQTAWTDVAWLVRFTAKDRDPWATLRERDARLWEEEVVEVFFDPEGNLDAYFEIEVNPLNAVCDLVLRRSRSGYLKNFRWNCENLRTSVTATREGWIAELRIPFESVSARGARPGDSWRVNFYRIDRPRNAAPELSAWSPTGRPKFHIQERFGWLDFTENPELA